MLTIIRSALARRLFIVFMSLFVIEAVETTTFLLLPQTGDIDQSTEKPTVMFFVQK